MKPFKYIVNLLSVITLAILTFLAVELLKSMTEVRGETKYTTFGNWFWFTIIVLCFVEFFTSLQIGFEKLLSKSKFFKDIK